ncbi:MULTISPECIES: hypothetical protein [Burkholderia]|uniref:Uncharacterized protein n=1 Tax=Burkholderia aenigmatica TaxID=2015348 RepID=A0A6J5JTP9_9BURK|nr:MULTISPECIES: hypothetical protein [Burkholderia]CAB3974551.1 hypothetical protein BLA3211_08071 [Burkholderia aenigmatica]
MADGRPAELARHVEAESEKNDKLIIEALAELEDVSKAGKRKATVATICQLTGLSRNTVRGRPWALVRLKAIKAAHKSQLASEAASRSEEEHEPTPRMLRNRIKLILDQNALLYEEILTLKGIISNQETEIEALKARSKISLAQPPGRVPE